MREDHLEAMVSRAIWREESVNTRELELKEIKDKLPSRVKITKVTKGIEEDQGVVDMARTILDSREERRAFQSSR